ncbi:MAG TPA: VF530 family protein [Bdellovibrionota bacterium]|jgi:uncharacterized protein (DUF2132 family)|nr:VF530 family protein [Bdellovibrionota bacterium]
MADAPRRKDPLEGKTLETILTELVAHYGWDLLGQELRINCFIKNPTMASCLKMLRRTPWARKMVEDMYRAYLDEIDDAR